MVNVTIREMLEAGTHFGHITGRWNPKMKKYIFGSRNGIHILDLRQSVKLFRTALQFVQDAAVKGEKILFVGTKKQFQGVIEEEAKNCKMHFVTHRWLGGMLTNFSTIRKSVERMKKMEQRKADGLMGSLKKKEVLKISRDIGKLKKFLHGVEEMTHLPSAIVVVDPNKEKIAISEAKKLNIPVIALTDTNCNPDDINLLVPGNDDAIRSIRLFASKVSAAYNDGNEIFEKTLRTQKSAASPEKKGEADRGEKDPKVVVKSKKVQVKDEDADAEEGNNLN
jgi:small subunit ribosomal protein S2